MRDGALGLYRSPGENRFTADDKRCLAGLAPFLAHALTQQDSREAPLVDSGKLGLIIADSTGKPIYSSAEGRRLLLLATHSRTAPSAVVRRAAALPPALARLCRDIGRIFAGDPVSAAPVHHHRNVWGGFTFRAHWLEAVDPTAGLVVITITYQEPLQTKLMRRLEQMPLSRRQAEVCLLMATGASYDQVAQKLGISKHTAVSHGRWIYEKLDVRNRIELVGKLISE